MSFLREISQLIFSFHFVVVCFCCILPLYVVVITSVCFFHEGRCGVGADSRQKVKSHACYLLGIVLCLIKNTHVSFMGIGV